MVSRLAGLSATVGHSGMRNSSCVQRPMFINSSNFKVT